MNSNLEAGQAQGPKGQSLRSESWLCLLLGVQCGQGTDSPHLSVPDCETGSITPPPRSSEKENRSSRYCTCHATLSLRSIQKEGWGQQSSSLHALPQLAGSTETCQRASPPGTHIAFSKVTVVSFVCVSPVVLGSSPSFPDVTKQPHGFWGGLRISSLCLSRGAGLQHLEKKDHIPAGGSFRGVPHVLRPRGQCRASGRGSWGLRRLLGSGQSQASRAAVH